MTEMIGSWTEKGGAFQDGSHLRRVYLEHAARPRLDLGATLIAIISLSTEQTVSGLPADQRQRRVGK